MRESTAVNNFIRQPLKQAYLADLAYSSDQGLAGGADLVMGSFRHCSYTALAMSDRTGAAKVVTWKLPGEIRSLFEL